MRLGFHGAAGTVTGSRFLLEAGGRQVLVDCGLFQGYKVLRERNWKRMPFDPARIDAVLLTHAHIDHSGGLPLLVRAGFKGPILATRATCDLARIMLPDSGRIQEEDARYANRKRFSRHAPALPLYTEEDAQRALERFRPVDLGEEEKVGKLRAVYQDAGHILGAASIQVAAAEGSVLFSGDLGPPDHLLITPPAPPGEPDWVVMESTYGDRLHPAGEILEALAVPLRRTLERGGVALIPSFAVGRSQTILYALYLLFEQGRLPRVPVYVDSPMATAVTELYRRHTREHRLSHEQCAAVCDVAVYTRSVDDSKALDEPGPPRIIISASGMLAGGRVLHHLKAFGPDAKNLVLMPGFQAPGTRGAALADGAREVKIHGRPCPVRAEVVQLSVLSAHADQAGLLGWLGRCARPPRRVFLVHGEPQALDALRRRVAADLGYPVEVADYGAETELA